MRVTKPWGVGLCSVLLMGQSWIACSKESSLQKPVPPTLAFNDLEKSHVIVFGIDGLGSHNAWRNTERSVPAPRIPHIEKLISQGAWSKRAHSDHLGFSAPNWMGMITSSPSEVHGVITNTCERGHGLETIFGVLRKTHPQMHTTVVYEWDPISCFPEANVVSSFIKTDTTEETTAGIISALRDQDSEFIFTDFDAVDAAGHHNRHGGSSVGYVEAVEGIDRAVAKVMAAVKELGLENRTHIILTADHGHQAEGGDHTPCEYPVPFIVYGPRVQAGEITEEVSNNQVAQVVAYLLNAPPSPAWSVGLAPFDRYIQPK